MKSEQKESLRMRPLWRNTNRIRLEFQIPIRYLSDKFLLYCTKSFRPKDVLTFLPCFPHSTLLKNSLVTDQNGLRLY